MISDQIIDIFKTRATRLMQVAFISDNFSAFSDAAQFLVAGETYPNSYYASIDVRDTADAHIQAFEVPSASGRYCLAANVNHFSEILKIVHEQFPHLQLPEK